MSEVHNESEEKRKRQRSPAYPFINLETAIKRAKEFYDREARNAVNIRVAAKHWGYEEKSSSGLQTAATLISFGLLSDKGMGDKRQLQLTQRALQILLDTRPDSKYRADAIKKAALTPKVHEALWKKWGSNLPSDGSLRYTLTVEWEPPFNDNAVDGFIREYKDTIAFAKLRKSDTQGLEVTVNGDEREETPENAHPLVVGDYVQWEPGGVLQFSEPRRLSRFSADGKYAFVDGSNTGAPVEELTKQDAPKTGTQNPAPGRSFVHLSHKTAIMREDVFSLTEGNATFQWPTPLSADSIADLKDWLKILERKISRPTPPSVENAE